jgi:RHS repeat-associated protein
MLALLLSTEVMVTAPRLQANSPVANANMPVADEADDAETTAVMPQVLADVEADVIFYHQDATGNLAAITNESGDVVWRADVRPFGQGTPSSPDYALRFLGQPREADLGVEDGLYHLGARYYDPLTGRFLSPDPLALTNITPVEPQRLNRYSYALNNPFRYTDPTGYAANAGTPAFRWFAKALADADLSPHARVLLKEIYAREGMRGIERLFAQESGGYGFSLKEADKWLAKFAEGSLQEYPGKTVAQAVKEESIALNNLRRAGGAGSRGFATLGAIFFLLNAALVAVNVQEALANEDYARAIQEAAFIYPLIGSIPIIAIETGGAVLDNAKFFRKNPACWPNCQNVAQ